MHGNDVSVFAHVGMGIGLGGFSMGCPAGMPDTAGAGYTGAVVGFLCKDLQPSLRLDDFCRSIAVSHSQPG